MIATKKVKFIARDILEDLKHCHNMIGREPGEMIEYKTVIAGVAAHHIHNHNEKALNNGASFGQQHILQKGLKTFGEKGKKAALKEMKQLHNRSCFEPILVSELTASEKKKAQKALIFLIKKRDGTIKGRTVYNGKPTRDWHDKEDSASPTASLESIFLTSIIAVKEERDIVMADIPNAFIQTLMPELEEGQERVIMKFKGAVLEILVELAPDLYGPYVVLEDGKRVLYLQVLRALYGMLVAALLWYRQFREDLESVSFKFDVYDPCVANRKVQKKHQTVKFHVDDLMSEHVDSKMNNKFRVWLNKLYGKHGKVTAA
jgi:hypothetical protein